MRSLLARKHKHCSTSRCIVVPAAVSLSLLLAALAASNVYFTFPKFPFPRPFSFSSLMTRRGGEGCDIFRGDWVPDPDAPYYTNDTCSVIHEHYDCMRYGKPDLGFVKWRWRPDGCDLPRFDPWRFLDMMRGKTIAFVGDSLARNHKDSLICLLTRAAEPTPSWPSSKQTVYYYGEYVQLHGDQLLGAVPGPARADRRGRAGAHGALEPLPRRAGRRVGGARPGVRLRRRVHAVRGRGARRVPGSPTSRTSRCGTRCAWPRARRCGRCPAPTAVLRTVDPSQYEGGEWNKDGNCVRTRPSRRGEKKLEGFELDFRQLQVEEFAAAEKAVADGGGKVRMMLMDTTAAMILRADAHPSKYRGWTPEKHFTLHNDCVHWCLPGAIDTWNDMLLHMLSSTK